MIFDIKIIHSISNLIFFIGFKILNALWNFKHFLNFTALILAADSGHKDIVELLLKQENIDINSQTV